MMQPSRWRTVAVLFVVLAGIIPAAPAQVFSTLVNFSGLNGTTPFGSLTQGKNGAFYGTAVYGGAGFGGDYSTGTLFAVDPTGDLYTLYSFCPKDDCSGGAEPYAGRLLASNNLFYGAPSGGGAFEHGTVFAATPTGAVGVVHSFDGTDGEEPAASPVQGTNESLYGTSSGGNLHPGTIYDVTRLGSFNTLHRFCSKANCTDGSQPLAELIQATDGNFYGTTYFGGDFGVGTVFKISLNGFFTSLHSFHNTDGAGPLTGLVEGADGNLYGSTAQGGANNKGVIFKLDVRGRLKVLYSFCADPGCADGAAPTSTLMQGTDGNLYGVTGYGGTSNACSNGCGTIFSLTPSGELTTLHNFDLLDGQSPRGTLLQATNGIFYGTTASGGDLGCIPPTGCGTIFSLDVGPTPFVSFLRGYARIGKPAGILGQGFVGTTSVTFNGVPASFTVNPDTYIRATVPPGATTGYVTVTTPTGTLT